MTVKELPQCLRTLTAVLNSLMLLTLNKHLNHDFAMQVDGFKSVNVCEFVQLPCFGTLCARKNQFGRLFKLTNLADEAELRELLK